MTDLKQGDCLEVLRALPDNSVDSLVTDPPAGISFMGKAWDDDKGGRREWITWLALVMRECHRVLKPGAHGLVWALPRTSHWTATALEEAGFEIRDRVQHIFGSGFPKSLDVSKAIDKAAGAEREVVGKNPNGRSTQQSPGQYVTHAYNPIPTPSTDAAKTWQGWGTALKPASEDWWLVRKPLSEKTVAANVLKWGTGALNIDASRIGTEQTVTMRSGNSGAHGRYGKDDRKFERVNPPGRFPSHLILDEEAGAMLDEQSLSGGMHSAGKARPNKRDTSGDGKGLFHMHGAGGHRLGDSGGASRFFYCAKVSASERNAGLEGMGAKSWKDQGFRDNESTHKSPLAGAGRTRDNQNHHPTVKPQKLMRYLCRMITPPGGTVLDCFMGSGSTGLAALSEGFQFIGIEREQEYLEIASKRIFSAFPEFKKQYGTRA